MDGDWIEVNRVAVNASPLSDLLVTPTTLAFDDRQELLWFGSESGQVYSLYSGDLRRYTSYHAHPTICGSVKQLLFHERGVLSVAQTSVHLASRAGLPLWHLEDQDTMQHLECMSFLGKDQSRLLVAGRQDVMLKIDVEKGKILDLIPTDRQYTLMKFSNYICAATNAGTIDLLDPTDLRVVKSLGSSSMGIYSMDAQNNLLVTCAMVNRQQSGPALAGLANVYDLRGMRQLQPVPFQAGAAFVQLHPRMSTTCIIASQNGQLQVVDSVTPNSVVLRQVNTSSYMTHMVLAPTGEALAISDAEGHIQIWGSPSKLQFCEFSDKALEWPDNTETPAYIDLDRDDIPLNSIGMPFYWEQLLSSWNAMDIYEVGHLPTRIDLNPIQKGRTNEIGIWVANPGNLRRNQVERIKPEETEVASILPPKFLSEKARTKDDNKSPDISVKDVSQALADTVLGKTTKTEVPAMYGNVEIKYSSWGVEDFDFAYYNKTRYSGLETHITNSYTNPLLQLLKFTPVIRNLALNHTAAACFQESCLLCEIGFLFDMLEKAEGKNCQATNFLKTFSNTQQAGRLGLLEENALTNPLTDMMQAACRFLLSQAAEEFRSIAPSSPLFEKAIFTDAITRITCLSCHNDTIQPGGTYLTDLLYLSMSASQRIRQPIPSFSQILRASVELQNQSRGWCDKCRRYQQLGKHKSVRQIPDVLIINAAIKSSEARQYWMIPGWLPTSIGVMRENGNFVCFEGEDLRLHLQKGMHVITVYDLVGFVADVHSSDTQKPHLVSLINVSISEREPTVEDDWHLFNDFLVCQITQADALKFSTWKLPSVLAFQARTARHHMDDSWKANMDTSLLYRPYSINNKPPESCQILDAATEAPTQGTIIAIDTEFVALQQAEIEVSASGDREIIRPTRLGLARVSVVRGSGKDEEVPFINDYITIHEQIVDYVTDFSGVAEGDLDPSISTHPLLPLKLAYKKLWLLLNLGCVFVGHGLAKDFRTINIHVPKAQTMDTVDCFFRPNGRKLSLRFLVWYFLKDKVQTGNHDSIEDAQGALRLWRKYCEFQDAGIVQAMVNEVYDEGRKWGWKPPWEASAKKPGRRPDLKNSDPTGIGGTGRETPDLLITRSVPGTPSGKKAGPGRGSEYFDSPLR